MLWGVHSLWPSILRFLYSTVWCASTVAFVSTFCTVGGWVGVGVILWPFPCQPFAGVTFILHLELDLKCNVCKCQEDTQVPHNF